MFRGRFHDWFSFLCATSPGWIWTIKIQRKNPETSESICPEDVFVQLAGVEGRAGNYSYFRGCVAIKIRSKDWLLRGGGLGIFQRSPLGLRKESQVSDLATGCTRKHRHFGVRVWEQMPLRGRAVEPCERKKGDRPVHIKFMTLRPSGRGGQTRSAKPKQARKKRRGRAV